MGKLILTRKRKESVELTINGQLVRVEVVLIDRDKVRLCFDADESVKIDRYEVAQAKRRAA